MKATLIFVPLIIKNQLKAPELAVRLEDALGIKAEFWMKYQVNYEIDRIRIKKKVRSKS